MPLPAEERESLEDILGHRFREAKWLECAVTHRSHREVSQIAEKFDNDRLEFLGDSVLGLVVSQHLMERNPEWDAGKLSKARSRLVNLNSVAAAARWLGLGKYLRLGPGEEKTGGREKRKLLADAFEAVTGAIYLDAGMTAATQFIERTLLNPEVAEQAGPLGEADHKSALQEWLQRRGLGSVQYRKVRERGPEHRKVFDIEVWLDGRQLGASEGMSKKEAEQAAAEIALETLERDAEVLPSHE
ncbi:MAG: ribonuclease III [Candidatus Acidiferrales bacterium]